MEHNTPHHHGGPTNPINVTPVDRRWHRPKTHNNWTYIKNPDNTITWTSPTGLTCQSTPTTTEPGHKQIGCAERYVGGSMGSKKSSAPAAAVPAPAVGTDAAFASVASGKRRSRRTLRNISEVRHFFRTNDVPIYFFGATPFNLLGLDRWVRNFSYVTYYDAWDGAHPRVFTPSHKPYREFESGEEINNWLLATPRCGHTCGVDSRRRPPEDRHGVLRRETEDICRNSATT